MSQIADSSAVTIDRPLSLESAQSNSVNVVAGLALFGVSVLGATLFWDNIASLRKPLQLLSFGAAAEGVVLGSALVVYELWLKKGPFADRSASSSGVAVTPGSQDVTFIDPSAARSSSSREASGLPGQASVEHSASSRSVSSSSVESESPDLKRAQRPRIAMMRRLAQSNSEEGKIAAAAFQNLLNGTRPAGIHILGDSGNIVFTIDAIPGVVFKAHTRTEEHGRPITGNHAEYCNGLTESRWNNINACREFVKNRPHLIVPDAIKLLCKDMTVKGNTETRVLLACEAFDVKGSGVFVEQDYTSWCENRPDQFEEVVREFIGFIDDTAYKDVCFRNNPVVEIDGKPRVILLDLEYCAVKTIDSGRHNFWRVAGGLWMGEHDARGLCRHLTPEMARRVRDAVPEGHLEGWDRAIARREHELEKRQRAVTWMQGQEITATNRKKIPESAARLSTLSQEQQELALKFIRKANRQIDCSSSTRPLWSQRMLYIKRRDTKFPHDKMQPIIRALRDGGHIFGKMPPEELHQDNFRDRRRYRVIF